MFNDDAVLGDRRSGREVGVGVAGFLLNDRLDGRPGLGETGEMGRCVEETSALSWFLLLNE